MANNRAISDVSIPLKVNRIIPENLATNFVQNIVVQHRPDHFVVSFFQTWDPILLGLSEDERRQKLEEMGTIDSICVSRIVVTPDAMRSFVGAMQENLGQYEDRFGQSSDTNKNQSNKESKL